MICHDCKKEIEEAWEFEGDFYKCPECYKKDPLLRNYRAVEVYSRITGYIRPTKNWNAGKKEEYKNRKTYELPNV